MNNEVLMLGSIYYKKYNNTESKKANQTDLTTKLQVFNVISFRHTAHNKSITQFFPDFD